MKTSEQINELCEALSKAQGEIQDPKMDATNIFFKKPDGSPSKYATQTAVMQAIRPVFSKHGLSLIQSCSFAPEGYQLVTRLLHKSGQFIEDSLILIINKKDMQGLAGAMTYAKRIQATAFAGIAADEDDDGNSQQSPKTHPPIPPPRSIQPLKISQPLPSPGVPDAKLKNAALDIKISMKQANDLKLVALQNGWTMPAINEKLNELGLNTWGDMDQSQYKKLSDVFNKSIMMK